ncbi:MAG: DUF5682 family protein [Labilithrix sp.]
MEPASAVSLLAGSVAPFVIGVRHHSPACAAAMPVLLDAFAPDRVLVELPADLDPWLRWLAHPDTKAPIALAAASEDGRHLSFYPFADFSPELAAIRWAAAHGVPVEAFDLPAGAREGRRASRATRAERDSLVRRLSEAHDADDVESLWDRMVEARAVSGAEEATRRAALLFGWALRVDEHAAGGVSVEDLRREAYMRRALARAKGRVAAVVGAFHGGALLDAPIPAPVPPADEVVPRHVVSSLVPYAFPLLDSRSGYPAGIRDPIWQQRAYEALAAGGETSAIVATTMTEIARVVRRRGHVASFADVKEATRLARDLATLRALPGPGRRELIESIESAMLQGERLGRGRIVARALEEVLVGQARGTLPRDVPRSGLAPHVIALLAEDALPGPPGEGASKETVLDPLRSHLDRRRQRTLVRLRTAGIHYAEEDEDRAGAGGGEALTTSWSIRWSPTTEATIEIASLLGVTLAQAARGALLRDVERAKAEDRWGAAALLAHVRAAAACGLGELVTEGLARFADEELAHAGLSEVTALSALVDRLLRGHVSALPVEPTPGFDSFVLPPSLRRDDVAQALVRAVEGLAGSTRLEDARALLVVVEHQLRERDADADDTAARSREPSEIHPFADGRIGFALDTLARDGSPLMQGAGGAARVLLGREDAETFGVRVGSFVDAGGPDLADRMKGALVLGLPLFEAHPGFAERLLDRLEAVDDRTFLERLPALRGGFAVLAPAARERLLAALAPRLGDGLGDLEKALELASGPELAARAARADDAARAAVAALGLALPPAPAPRSAPGPRPRRSAPGSAISLADRIRLALGRENEKLAPRSLPYAIALDELYGRGRGEGSRQLGPRGGKDAPFPTVREWAEELEALFGAAVREEILGEAAGAGRPAAALMLDPDVVRPSVELLEQVLSLKGGLAERDLHRLRALVQRIVDALVEALAVRVRPALTGLVTAAPTRRAIGPLDLRRTVLANLRTARRADDGSVAIVAERLFFRQRAKRSLDWRIVLVVDVSGSMEASVIYSAIMAAILSALPAITVHFVAFNTTVMDLSERVDDPLGLLLEISVGGGTDIGRGLRYARGLVKVPQRTIVVVVSDFEEGASVPALVAEVQALAESGVRVLGLAALDDRGAPRYHAGVAKRIADAGASVAALTPLELCRWVGEQIR